MMSTPNRLHTPGWLQKIRWVLNPIRYMEDAAQQYPDMFTAEVIGFGGSLIFVNHPTAIQTILTHDRKQFSAPGELNQILSPLLGYSSVMMLEGDSHRQRRQLVMPSFHGDRLKSYAKLIEHLTVEACDRLPIGAPFLARSVMQQISLQVILRAVFGLSQGERLEQIRGLLSSIVELFNSPLSSSFLFFNVMQQDLGGLSPWGRFLQQRQAIDQLIYAEIAERRQQGVGDRTDILSFLMLAEDDTGQPLSDQELRDELITLLVAGHETTATAMSWALYWLHRLPEVKAKVQQELEDLSAVNRGAIDPISVTRLPYFTAFCNEVLRIHPVGMLTFPRLVQEPIELLGHCLLPGMVVVGCIYLVHQRQDLYPQPTQFRPERFLERQFSPYEFIPFGGGSRRCMGETLALFEMKLVLATMLSRYELERVDDMPEVPRRRGVTLAPKGGVKLRLIGRRISTQENLLAKTAR